MNVHRETKGQSTRQPARAVRFSPPWRPAWQSVWNRLGKLFFQDARIAVEKEWQSGVEILGIISDADTRSRQWQRLHELSHIHFPGRWLEIEPQILYLYPLTVEDYVLFMRSSEHLLAMNMSDVFFRLMEFWLEQTKPATQPNQFLRAMAWSYTLQLFVRLPQTMSDFFLQYIEERFFVHEEPDFFLTFSHLLKMEREGMNDVWRQSVFARIHVILRARLCLENLPLRRKAIWEFLVTTLTPSLTTEFSIFFKKCMTEFPSIHPGSDAVWVTAALVDNIGETGQKETEKQAAGRENAEKNTGAERSAMLVTLIPAIAGIILEQLPKTRSPRDWQLMVGSLFRLQPWLPPQWRPQEYQDCQMKWNNPPRGFIQLGNSFSPQPLNSRRKGTHE